MHSDSTATPATVTLAQLRELLAVAAGRYPEQRARIERGALLVALRRIVPDPQHDGVLVESESEPGAFHAVDPNAGLCGCRDFQHRGIPCKHLWAVKLLRAIVRQGRGAIAPAA